MATICQWGTATPIAGATPHDPRTPNREDDMSIEILSVEPVTRKKESRLELADFGDLCTGRYFYRTLQPGSALRRKVEVDFSSACFQLIHATGEVRPIDRHATVYPVDGPDSPPPDVEEEEAIMPVGKLEPTDCFRRVGSTEYEDEILMVMYVDPAARVPTVRPVGPLHFDYPEWTIKPDRLVQLLRVEARFVPQA